MKSEQFETICAALADKITAMEMELLLRDYEIDTLKAKLKEAEEAAKQGKKPVVVETR